MCRHSLSASATALVGLAGALAISHPAQAIPAFAAQTGLACDACHIGFPQLTPFGRLFKLEGYTLGEQTYPHIHNLSAMLQAGFTYLKDKVPGGLSPDYPSNHAWSVQQTSLFYGGVLDKNLGLGGFIQGTFDGVAHQFHWDNLDIRDAHLARLAGRQIVYGFTFNNAPGITDVWNTLPAWGYPYIPDELGVSPTAELQISGLAQSVVGVGGYTAYYITPADMIYGEVDGYQSLPDHTAYALGVGPANGVGGTTPYWRLAFQHSVGENSFEFGTSGLVDHPYPSGFKHGPEDNITDLGLDMQIQHITMTQAVSLQASWYHESQHWGASFPLGNTANLNDTLNQETITVSYLWHELIGATESYSNISGTADSGLYGPAPISGNANNKPNSSSFTTELDYYPFNNGGPKIFPWVNAKFFLEGTIYPTFNGLAHNYDGSGRSASANNLIFAGIWLVF
ncbi:MAG: hypothetical protein KJS74_02880 [Rhodospirillales bacterium]|nr:hypothetical protein [Rhodospirillales bacterium]